MLVFILVFTYFGVISWSIFRRFFILHRDTLNVSTFYLLGDWLVIDFSKGGEGRIFFRFSKGREIVHLVYRN